MKNWKTQLFNIPNMLSMFRLVLIPIYIEIYLQATEPAHYYVSGGILAVSCLTDMVDGKIARHFNMVTNVGKLLDPIADKFTQLALVACLSIRHRVLRPVLLVFLTKEFFQFFAAWFNFRRGKVLNGALMAGKICTAVLFISFTILVLFPNLSTTTVTLFALVDILFMSIAFIQYIFAFFGKHTKLHDFEQ